MKKISGYMIAVPDKNNPKRVKHFYVTGPRFLYKDKIIKEYYDDGTERVVKEVEIKTKKENNPPPLIAAKSNELEQEEKIRLQIAAEVKRILNEKKNKEPNKKTNSAKMRSEKKISRPKKDDKYFKLRYTAPKERGILARIINRKKYENGWYNDVEDYLNDENNFVWNDMERSKNAEKRRDQRLYKRVQAYEDAEDDIAMKKTFIAIKVTTAAALIATLGLSVKFLHDEVYDLIHNSSYIARAEEKSTLSNANEVQIEYAKRVLDKIDYEFEYLSNNELLDTIIRVGREPSNISGNRAKETIKDSENFADQKLLESIVQEAYGADYIKFSNKEKQELNQLVYEMLDKKAKIWIRSPEKVSELLEKNTVDKLETEDMESGR